jgi:signal transduction histidine kinase
MAFAGPLDLLGLFLIAVGVTLLAASYRIARLARSNRRRMETLLQLASEPLDPLELPAAAWRELADGGWTRLSWEGSWFGQPVAGVLGTKIPEKKATAISSLDFKLVSGDEVELRLSLTHSQAWGEERLFAEHLARVFVLLLETRLHARTEALSAALAERARLSLYLQHDMRNLAQWVLWVSDDFAACETAEAMLATARRLRDNAPLARDRAERLIGALGKDPAVEHPTLINLREATLHAARLAGVEPAIVGEASAWVAAGLLARALDNLFANLAAAWRETASATPTLQLRTTTNAQCEMAELDFFSPWPPEIVPLAPENIFEPFASGRPRGLGLGLYQARKSLREAGGDLQASASPEGLCFLLRLPAHVP